MIFSKIKSCCMPRTSFMTRCYVFVLFGSGLLAQTRILAISPTSGAEGSRVEIIGTDLENTTSVMFGKSRADFRVISSGKLITIVPRWVAEDVITVVGPQGRASSPIAFVVRNDLRVPEDVGWKGGYVNSTPPPWPFHSVLLWGIAIADTRVPGHESATVEVASTRLSCRVDGKNVILNNDSGSLRGGLYLRHPWFAQGNFHDTLPFDYNANHEIVILRIGERPDRVWHFWPPSPRPTIPPGKLEGCTVRARVRISRGALLQMGADYWRDAKIPWDGSDGNNHEAGASNWYLPSSEWQEATFTDIGGAFQ
jgi:hypothetical protein